MRGSGAHSWGRLAEYPGNPPRKLAHRAEADGVVVAAGQQCRPGRRAQGRDVEAVIAQALPGQPRVVPRSDGTSERLRIAETRVVDEDQQHIGGAVRRRRVPDQAPVGLRTFKRSVCYPLKRRSSDRESGAVDLCHCHPPVGSYKALPAAAGRMVPWRRQMSRSLFLPSGPEGALSHGSSPSAGDATRRLQMLTTCRRLHRVGLAAKPKPSATTGWQDTVPVQQTGGLWAGTRAAPGTGLDVAKSG